MTQAGTAQVFISYQHDDRSYADAVYDWLTKVGITCWYDRRVHLERMHDEIVQRIHDCRVLVVLVSPTAVHSDWVNDELSFAKKGKKRKIVPIVVKPVDEARLPGVWALLNANRPFFKYHEPSHAEARELLEEIRRYLATPENDSDIVSDPPRQQDDDVPPVRRPSRTLGRTLVLSMIAALVVAAVALATLQRDPHSGRLWYAHWFDPRPHAFDVRRETLGSLVGGIRSPAVSPDGRHFAYATPMGNQWAVVHDGQPGPACDEIGATLALEGAHVGYAVRVGRKWRAVVDGVAGPEVEGIEDGSIRFSPDGGHVAYRIKLGTAQAVAIGDRVGQAYPAIVQGPTFSPDGRHVGYVVASGGGQAVVVDGTMDAHYAGIGADSPVFGPAGDRVAYAASDGATWTIVADGRSGPVFSGLHNSSPTFSPDGRHLAYLAHDAERWVLVIDNERIATHDGLGPIVYGADGSRYAYSARDGDTWHVVCGTHRYPKFAEIDQLAISPDGRHVAYRVDHGGRKCVVLDDRAGPEYDDVGPVVFSPNGRRTAYFARTSSNNVVVVVDGVPGAAFDAAGRPAFSPDSRSVAYWAQRGQSQFAVVDGHEGAGLTEILTNELSFDAQGQLAYVAREDATLLRLTHTPTDGQRR